MEKFAQTGANKKRLVAMGAPTVIYALEKRYCSRGRSGRSSEALATTPRAGGSVNRALARQSALSRGLCKVEVGFCAMWALDNMFPCEGRAFAMERTDVSTVNVMLDPRDATSVSVESSCPLTARNCCVVPLRFKSFFVQCEDPSKLVLPPQPCDSTSLAPWPSLNHSLRLDRGNVSAGRSSSQFLKLSPDGLEIRNDALSFESVRATCCAQGGGQWYYEVTVFTGGIMQLGWATEECTYQSEEGFGIGDDAHSLSYDGCRQLLWHAQRHRKHWQPKWKPGEQPMRWPSRCRRRTHPRRIHHHAIFAVAGDPIAASFTSLPSQSLAVSRPLDPLSSCMHHRTRVCLLHITHPCAVQETSSGCIWTWTCAGLASPPTGR